MWTINNNPIVKHYTARLFMSSIILTLSSANFAFDNQGFAQTQAMTPFIERFGDYDPNTKKYSLPSTFLSYSNAFPFLLLICGIFIGSEIASRFGRRMTVFVMSIWAMICVPIVVTSSSRNQFLAGRCLNSLYIGMEMAVIPIYQSEIVPAAVRGLAVGSYQMSFGIGGFVISGICYRTSQIANDWSWRIPFLFYLVVPFIISYLIWFQPESPRWLASKGKIDAARHALTLFRKEGHDVEQELAQILVAVELEKKKDQGSYKSCFTGSQLRRTIVVLGANFFLQACGQAFVSLYGPVVINQLGGISTFHYTLISAGVTMFGYAVSLSVNDYVGRRPIMIVGSACQAIAMFVIGAAGSVAQNTSTRNTVVAFIILFGFSFGVGWAPTSYILSAEIPSQRLREKTSRMGFIVGIIIQFVVAFSLPYMINAPGWLGVKVGFIFAPMSILACLFAIFFIPECKGLRLEQIDLLFEERIPAIKSKSWGKANKQTALVEGENGETVGVHDGLDTGIAKLSTDNIEKA